MLRREGGKEREREGGREGRRERGKEREMEGGREGEGEREEGSEIIINYVHDLILVHCTEHTALLSDRESMGSSRQLLSGKKTRGYKPLLNIVPSVYIHTQ